MILRDGRRTETDEGPSRARVQGYGGSLVSMTVTPAKYKLRMPRQKLSEIRERPRCGRIMPKISEPCYRRSGHADTCRSLDAVTADTERRRARPR